LLETMICQAKNFC